MQISIDTEEMIDNSKWCTYLSIFENHALILSIFKLSC